MGGVRAIYARVQEDDTEPEPVGIRNVSIEDEPNNIDNIAVVPCNGKSIF